MRSRTQKLARGFVALVLGGGLAAQWTEIQATNAPSPRHRHAMAYDEVHRRVVLFGGWEAFGASNETWLWDGSSWSRPNVGIRPQKRFDHAMAYDSYRQRVVLFGGSNGLTALRDTWEWDGTRWSDITRVPSPEPRSDFSLTYDDARGETILFGGYGRSTIPSGDTWLYQPAIGRATPYGSGCGPAPLVALSSPSRPEIGVGLVLDATDLSPTALATAMALGSSRTRAGPFPLPLPLDGFGLPGCALYQNHEIVWLATVSGGRARLTVPVPYELGLVACLVYFQAYVVDPRANAAGTITTNGLEVLLGS